MTIRSWIVSLIISSWLVLLSACGGGGLTTALAPGDPGIPQGDIGLAINGSIWNLGVQFPPLRSQPARTGRSSTIPFGTEEIRVTATSETSGFPYTASLTLTRSQPRGVLQSVPPQASIRVEVEALSGSGAVDSLRTTEGSLVLASATTIIPPETRGPVVLRLIPASFLPVLQGILPNPVPAHPNGFIRLVGQNLDRVAEILFTAPTTTVSVALPPGTNPAEAEIQVPPEAITGEVIALDSLGFGVGSVNLVILGSPTPTFSPTPDPEVASLFFQGVVETVDTALAGQFTPGMDLFGGVIFLPSTLPRSGSTPSQAVFDALLVTSVEVGSSEDSYEVGSVAPEEIQVDDGVGDPPQDRFAILSRELSGDSVNGFVPREFALRLDDSTGTILSDAQTLPANPASLPFTQKQFFLFFESAEDVEAMISGSITALSPLPTPSPSPDPDPPLITSCSPTSGTMASDVTITGTNLPGVGVTEVLFNGIPSQGYGFIQTGEIIVEVPVVDQLDALNGPIVLRNTFTSVAVSCPEPFVVTDFPPPPRIDSFAPLSGSPGERVFLEGQFFRRTTGVFFQSLGDFPDLPSFSYSFSNRTLDAEIPAGAVTGRITIVTEYGSTSTASDFEVLDPPLPPLELH